MKKRELGNGGLTASALAFGSMGLSFGYGPAMEKDEAIKIIRAAYDGGVTFFDTAKAYGPFTNEDLLVKRLPLFATRWSSPRSSASRMEFRGRG